MVTSVSAIAISGEAIAISVGAFGAPLKHQLHAAPLAAVGAPAAAPPISSPSCSRVASRGVERRRQLAVKHHRDAVGDFGELVEILADDQHGGAAAGEIDQRLADDRGRAGIDAPGRLADDEDARLAQDFAADHEFLQIAAGEAGGFRIALGLAHVEGLGGAIDVRRASPRLSMKPRLTMPLAAWPVSSAFSDSFMRGAAPWPSRSSGHEGRAQAPARR